MRLGLLFFKSLVLIVMMISFSPHAFAAEKLFTGNISSDSNVAGNWDPEGVPGPNDDVLIRGDVTIDITRSLNIGSITVEQVSDTNTVGIPTVNVSPGVNIIVNNGADFTGGTLNAGEQSAVTIRGVGIIPFDLAFNQFGGGLILDEDVGGNSTTGQDVDFFGNINFSALILGLDDSVTYESGSTGTIGDTTSANDVTRLDDNASVTGATFDGTRIEIVDGATPELIDTVIMGNTPGDTVIDFQGSGFVRLDGTLENVTVNGDNPNDSRIITNFGDELIIDGNTRFEAAQIVNDGTLLTAPGSTLELSGATQLVNISTISEAMQFSELSEVLFRSGGGSIERSGGSNPFFNGATIVVEDGAIGIIRDGIFVDINTISGTGGGELSIQNGSFQHNTAGQFDFAADMTFTTNVFHSLANNVELTINGEIDLDNSASGTSFINYFCAADCTGTVVNVNNYINLNSTAGNAAQLFTAPGGAVTEFGDGSGIRGAGDGAAQAVINNSTIVENATSTFENTTAFINGSTLTAGANSTLELRNSDLIITDTGVFDGSAGSFSLEVSGESQLSIGEESEDTFFNRIRVTESGFSLEASSDPGIPEVNPSSIDLGIGTLNVSQASVSGPAFQENGAGTAFNIGTLEIVDGVTASLFDAFPTGDALIVDTLILDGDLNVIDPITGAIIPVFFNTLIGNGTFIGLSGEVPTPATWLLILLGIGAMKNRK